MAATYKSRFPQISVELAAGVDAIIGEVAEAIAADAASRAPSGPGNVHLRDHFGVERTGPAEYVVTNDAVAESGRPVPYAIAVEFGHTAQDGSQVAPQPFLVPAKEAHTEPAAAAVTALLQGL